MTIEEAKKLLELQACITQLLDEFVEVTDTLSVDRERESLKRAAAEAIGTCVTDIILPITSHHTSLNPYQQNKLAVRWWEEARKRKFHEIASRT